MLDRAAQELGLTFEGCFLVGDSERDIQAAKARGCTAILVGEPSEDSQADHFVHDLAEAVDLILRLVAAEGTD